MKRIAIISAGLLATLLAACVLGLWLVPSDVVKSSYQSLEAARQAQLFERGWLPEILPPSSSRILVSTNLDVSTSWGSFEFEPSEWALLQAKLAPGAPSAPFVDWESTVAENRRKGLDPWHHSTSDTHWVFFCNSKLGRCEYDMWMPRGV